MSGPLPLPWQARCATLLPTMAMRAAQWCAKITPPRLSAVLARSRLFRRLDAGRVGPLIWISAPAGSGKTTLVKSWLDERKLLSLWYQCDAGDADLATFFHYLGLAGQRAAPRFRTGLPRLTAEYLAGLPVFVRRYFEALGSRLTPPAVIVFDDYQDVPAAAPLHAALGEGLLALPPGVTSVVVSRTEPPPALARLCANASPLILGWDDLRLTLGEVRGVERLSRTARPTRAFVDELHEKTQGWAAGLVLLLQHGTTVQSGPGTLQGNSPQVLFDYFAGEIFAKLEAQAQRVLLVSSLLPKMTTSTVEQLTGMAGAGGIVEELHRKNYFTMKHAGGLYEFHPLFREFLLSRGRQTFAHGELAATQRRAAVLLAAEGEIEAAAQLAREAGDWDALAGLVLKFAQALVQQGRSRTIEVWLQALPPARVAETPWLLYWLGVCRLPYAPAEARSHFTAALALFDGTGDAAGVFLSWSGAVDSFVYEFGDFKPLARFVDTLPALLQRYPVPLTGEIGTRVVVSMFSALMYSRPSHPDLPVWEARAREVVVNSPDITTRVTMGHQLLYYYSCWYGDRGKAIQLADLLRQSVEHKKATPLASIVWYAIEAIYHWKIRASREGCLSAVRRGLELAAQHGIHVYDTVLCADGAWGTLTFGDLDGAREFLRRMQATQNPGRHVDVCQYHLQAYLEAAHRGEQELAGEEAKACFEAAQASGVPFACAITHVAMGRALYGLGAREEALAHLGKACELGDGTRSNLVKFSAYRAYAEIELLEDGGGDLAALRRLMTLGAAHGYLNETFWSSTSMSRLCAAALAHGIEPAYARTLIRVRRLLPPQDGVAATWIDEWPYAIKIRTLGGFAIEVKGKPLRFAGKVQKKPLELLKVAIASGGTDVAEDRISEVLWPDADGDAARISFKTTLHRLRQLLGDEDVLIVREGRLSLDPQRVWVDVWAFERLLGEEVTAKGALERAVLLYRGQFLAGEESPWAVSARERLRARFGRAVARLGSTLDRAGSTESALNLYQKAIDVDDVSEEMYRLLMVAYAKLGRNADAAKAFERCRKTLAAGLKVEPSEETEVLYQSLVNP